MSTGNIPIARCAGRRCNVRATATMAASTGRASGGRKDYYKVLSLEPGPDVGVEEIKHAYRRLARRHHPDVCSPSRRAESTELFLELRRAYETLSDPVRKVRYDADLRTHNGEVVSRRRGVALARDVWESQLSVLHARSEQRQRARRSSKPWRPN